MPKGSLKKTAYFMTLDQKVGGYLFQNIISFEEEIVTYVKGGWVTNTDARVVKGYMRDPGQQGDGDDIHTLLPPPYRLGAVDTHLISPVFLPFDIAKDRKITDNIYQNPDSCVL